MLEKMNKFKLNGRYETRTVISVIVVGFLLRLLWVLEVSNEPISDFQTYYNIAVSLANGEIPAMFGYQGPGYPLILAGVFFLFNTTDIIYAKLFNVLLSTATLWFIYCIAKKLFNNNKKLSLIVLLFMVFMPNYVSYTNVLGTETFFLFLFTLIIWLFLADFNSKIKYPLVGIVIGIAALTKPQLLAYPVILMCIKYLKERQLKSTILSGSVIVLFMGCTILPMTVFNYLKHEQIIPVSYNGGYVLYINNNSENTNGMYMDVTAVTASEELLKQLQEKGVSYGDLNAQVSGLYQQEAVNWIIEHPLEFAKLGLLRLKATYLHGAVDIQYWTMPTYLLELQEKLSWNQYVILVKLFNFFTNIIVFIITLCGLIYAFLASIKILKHFKTNFTPYILSVPVFNILFFVAITFVFEGQTRYNFPILFMFAIVTVYVIERTYHTIRKN